MIRGVENRVGRLLIKLSLAVWAFFVLYPLLWTVLSSVKDNKQFLLGKPWDFPKLPLLWENFHHVWTKYHFGGYFINSLIVTVVSTVLAVLLSSMTAYIIARYSFKGKSLLFYSYLLYLTIPTFLGIIPLFFLLDQLHLTNNLLGLIIVYTITSVPFNVFVLVGFFKTLPGELEEAAGMDGATYYQIFFRVMLPLARPGLISVGIMTVLSIWNEYVFALVLLNDPAMYTIPVAVAVMQGEMQYRTEWGPLFAALLISMGPVLLFYILFQRRITGGLTAGAVKG